MHRGLYDVCDDALKTQSVLHCESMKPSRIVPLCMLPARCDTILQCSRMEAISLAFILYLLTGIATAVPIIYALKWAVWGAPIILTEYVSLLGSVALVVSAFISLTERRIAARIALISVLAVWSFYFPAISGVARMKLTDQRLALHVVKWLPSSQPLEVTDPIGKSRPNARLSAADIERLKSAGVTGKVEIFSFDNYGNGSKQSAAIVVIQNPVTAPVELPEPNATAIVYVQHADGWRLYPADAPTLKRTIRIQPIREDPKQSELAVELSSGARQGFGIWWPKSEPEKP